MAIAGESKLVRKATDYEQKAEASLSGIGFAAWASRASRRRSRAAVTHRFFRRGKVSGEPLRRLRRRSLKPETLIRAQAPRCEYVEVFMWPRASARTFCVDSGAIPPHQGLSRNQP